MNSSFEQIVVEQLAAKHDDKHESGYVVHLPRTQHSYLGVGIRQEIAVWTDRVSLRTPGQEVLLKLEADPFEQVVALMDASLPSVWMVSPDLVRASRDPSLPLIWCLQPEQETELPESAFATADNIPLSLKSGNPGWVSESDSVFLERLHVAIARLQAAPEGKIILTRPYEKHVGEQDILKLFTRFAAMEPSAAGSHFFRLGRHVESLGCSPENVFELIDGMLSFDVVAATRGIADDPAVDAQWLAALKADPKERREHLMALARYQGRIESLIEPCTLNFEKHMDVLQLGRVRHLYSRLSGRLRSDLTWLKLLKSSFPALGSYPEELQAWNDRETTPLRFYGGVWGRVGPAGTDARFYLNLRAALKVDETLYTQGGVGVIVESEPDKELLEVKNKLRALMQAVALWEQAV
ncbi:chorismate-binding protein [Aromatoleum aromaticum]|uniref:chorismate-binding protein n=1 Tax=Aromatoleum aromaticum TaxID=551760 RepID=UPI001459F4F9|nr:chorismate-binding protein [Aromatoleum aromaticum]NMG56570.1 hypothetical protein [Aromatoleum aromaticum]